MSNYFDHLFINYYNGCTVVYTTQHRTVLIIFASYTPENHHSSDDVYWREEHCGQRSDADHDIELSSN